MKNTQQLPLGIVLEKRASENQWIDFEWRAISVLPGAAENDDWVEIGRAENWTRYYAATLPLEIFRKETEGYKFNLSLDRPSVYVVLRENEDDDEYDMSPFLVTVCPYEAQDYLDSGEEIVDAVAMPDAVKAWLAEFVEAHHVDEPFKKRKRLAFDPRKEGFDKSSPRITRKWNRPANG